MLIRNIVCIVLDSRLQLKRHIYHRKYSKQPRESLNTQLFYTPAATTANNPCSQLLCQVAILFRDQLPTTTKFSLPKECCPLGTRGHLSRR